MKTAILFGVTLLLTIPAATAWSQSGGYGGVTLNGGEPPSPKAPPPGFQYVTWPGFRVSEGGSEVFLQLTGPVTFKEKRKGSRIMITLEKTQVYLKNNLRPVITRSFNKTPVSQFRLRRLKGDRLRLDIYLRRKASYTLSSKNAGQYHYLIVSFPPGS